MRIGCSLQAPVPFLVVVRTKAEGLFDEVFIIDVNRDTHYPTHAHRSGTRR